MRSRLVAYGVVGVTVVAGLWVLGAEKLTVQNVNDADVHLQMIRWAEHRIGSGNTPLDGWFPFLTLGFSLFHHYQSLPHILSGLFALPFTAQDVFGWSLYLLLAGWPLCIYWTGRLLGLDRLPAAAVAAVSPLLVSAGGIGYEYGAYTWQGFGVWSQLWGMWMLPIACATTWRAMRNEGSHAWAALSIGLTIASHLITGFIALVWIGVLILAKPRAIRRRVPPAVAIGIGAALAVSWFLVPLFIDRNWASADEFGRGSPASDSYGARRVLSWLVTGDLFDAGRRLPFLTVLLAIGIAVAVWRSKRDELSRALLIAFALGVVLYFGRSTLGPVLRFMPGYGDLPMHRFIMAVHLPGVFLIGIGLHAVAQAFARRFRRVLPSVAAIGVASALAAALLLPGWLERSAAGRDGARLIRDQRSADLTEGPAVIELVRSAKARGDGRVYAGLRANWGAEYRVHHTPVYSILANEDADAIGFTFRTASLSANIEARFDETNPAHYDLFNVRYLLLPSDRKPSVPAELLQRSGNHTLWRVETPGYVEVVDTIAIVSADRSNIGPAMTPFLRTRDAARGRYRTVAFDGRPAPTPTRSGARGIEGNAGTVGAEEQRLRDGFSSAEVVAKRRAVVLLKATFDPRWHATVDGVETPTQMIAPSFVGVAVEPGRHDVVFEYRPYPYHLPLLLLGVAALAALHLGPRWWRRARRDKARTYFW